MKREEINKRIDELTNGIVRRFIDSGFNVNDREVRKRLKLLLLEFSVPEREAVKTVINYLMKDLDITREQLVAEAPLVKVSDITKPGEWISLKAKVVQLWDTTSPNVSQVGLIGDETGIIKFVVWTKAEKDEIEEDKSYLFKNIITDSFGGRMQVNVNRNSKIEEIDEDIKLPPREIEVVGSLVAIQQNSGLIRRCKLCDRAITKVCPVHGKVESYDDLRIKGVIDDGENCYEVIFNQDVVKSLTGIGIEEALRIARNNLDRNAVLAELKKKLLGRYFQVSGIKGERYLIVSSVETLRPNREIVRELLADNLLHVESR